MTDEEKQVASERRKMISMLKSLYELAEHSTLSGAFRKGAEIAVDHYNRILARLGEHEDFDGELFRPLEPTMTFHEVGVSAKLLKGWLEAGMEKEDSHKAFGFHFDVDGLSQLGEVGRKIRDEFNVEKTIRVNVDREERDRAREERSREREERNRERDEKRRDEEEM
ncbi:MAG: hypothetical protein QM758_20835 [Armatimonas sp.]